MRQRSAREFYYCRWMDVVTKTYEELTTSELYSLLELRAEVFVVEQNCPYQDLDNRDQEGIHLLGLENGVLLAYARILKPGSLYVEPSIGRVITKKSARGTGLGKAIFAESISVCHRLFQNQAIRIMAQSYLVPFYQAFGFSVDSDEFLEDGIPHVEMIG